MDSFPDYHSRCYVNENNQMSMKIYIAMKEEIYYDFPCEVNTNEYEYFFLSLYLSLSLSLSLE